MANLTLATSSRPRLGCMALSQKTKTKGKHFFKKNSISLHTSEVASKICERCLEPWMIPIIQLTRHDAKPLLEMFAQNADLQMGSIMLPSLKNGTF